MADCKIVFSVGRITTNATDYNIPILRHMYVVNVKFSEANAVWKTVTRVQRKRSTAGILVYARRNGVWERESVFAHRDLKRNVVPLAYMCENMKWYTATNKGGNNRIGRIRSEATRT
jgi:hypothetical protein